MAEGLQRKIEYSDLKFTSSFAREKILDFQTWEVPGEHARGNFRLLLSENETGINSMNAPIQLLGCSCCSELSVSSVSFSFVITLSKSDSLSKSSSISGMILGLIDS